MRYRPRRDPNHPNTKCLYIGAMEVRSFLTSYVVSSAMQEHTAGPSRSLHAAVVEETGRQARICLYATVSDTSEVVLQPRLELREFGADAGP